MLLALLDAGYTPEQLNRLANMMLLARKLKTAVSIKSTKSNKANTQTTAVSVSMPPDEKVKNYAYTYFGGFGPGQISYLLRYADANTIIGIMRDLRNDSWKYGWVRTRQAVESLARAA
jgi:hypothetical protein